MFFIGPKRSPVTVIILGLVTCGIYYIWWLYTVGEEINMALGREAVKPSYAVISLICFPLLFYYVYTLDEALKELCYIRGNVPYSSNFVLWVITMLFGVGNIIVGIQVQETLNKVWDSSANMQQQNQ